jgi:iron complex outermembrane receptor protein
VFGEVTYSLTDKWSVTGGARWFQYDRKEYDIYNVPRGLPVGLDYAGGGRTDRKGKDEDTVFKFGTEYHFDNDRMVYLLYSEGFRLGGNNSARAVAAGFLPDTYEPDTLKNYEAGLKSQWFNNALQLNVSVFFMQWDNIQVNTSGSNLGAAWWQRGTFNGGKAEQKGVELSGTWKITDNFSIDGSAFFADPEFSEDTVYPDPEEGVYIQKGTVMPDSPKRKFLVAAEYNVPQFLSLNGNLWMRASYTYQSEIWNDLDAILDNDREQLIPSTSNTTLQVGFEHKSGWEASLVVRNVFDEKGINWLSTSNYGDLFGDPRYKYVRTLQRPRTIGLSFTKKW